IGRHPRDRKRMSVSTRSGRAARTAWRVLRRFEAAERTLLEVRPETGRTHQIRVHLADTGHPIVCDPIYGAGWERGMAGAGGQWALRFARRVDRLFLHAARLSFTHPVSGERLTFTSPLPEALAGALEWARSTA
ncbi:MAG: pseudouridine synthase, partial [Gemmatimonadota bacterium]|nr:pseudouridine synthase [Gemmatimonadota bacterium]